MSDKAPSTPGGTTLGVGDASPNPPSGTRTSGPGAQLTQTPAIEVGGAKTSYSVYVDEDSSNDSVAWFGDSDSDEDRLLGTVLSNTYKVVRVLGEGGMGRVYEAHHTRIASKRFAVKALHPEFARRKDVLERFQREVEAAASINNPYVLGVYDVGETDDGRPYLVSELLEGEELGDYLDKVGMMSIAPAVRIVRQVCKALAAAHAVGVVHRDIKPENVFLSGDTVAPTIKVLDFGISRLEGRAGNTLTKTGMVMGTPSYMSPEQARGERVDQRTDIYAAGAILYRAVTGKIPFDKDDATATLAAVLMEEPEPPRAIAPHIPEHLELIIQRAMARNPDDRYPEIEELDAALEPFDEKLDPAAQALDAQLSGRRPRMASQTTLVSMEHELIVQGARPQLFLLCTVIAVGVVMSIMGLATGMIRLARDGSSISGTEALVIMLVVMAGLATPTVLVAQHIKNNMWRNTAKVVEMVQLLREPVLIGLAASGLLAIVVRVLETAVLRTPEGLSWAAWDLLVPSAGVLAGLAAFFYRRLRTEQRKNLSGATLLGVFGAVTILGAVVIAMARDDIPLSPTNDDAPAASASTETPGVAPDNAGDRTPAATTKSDRALPGRTQAAYDVWKELYEQIRRRKLSAAMDSLDKLVQLDSTALDDKDVRDAVLELMVQAFYQRNEYSDRMARIATEKLGHWGPDLLFEIMVTRGETEADRQAQQLLSDEAVRGRGSEGMRLALAIRTAKGCEEKKARIMLARKAGDHRVLREINILQRCRRGPCCLNDDEDVDAVAAAIKARQQ